MRMQQSLFSSSLLLLFTFLYTTSAQLSPVSAPAKAPPAPALPISPTTSPPVPPTVAPATAPAAAPGMSTVPLVPTTPTAAPTPKVPKGPIIDIVEILRKAKKFSVFIRLLKTTQLANQLSSQLMTSGSSGLTVFAPDDSAFSKLKAGFLNTLGDRQKVELLQFHTISSFISISNFDTLTNPVQTQAGDDPKRLQLNVTTYGGSTVSMTTGVVNASVTGTVYSDNKLAIYQVDKVLLPLDIVLEPKAPAAAPASAGARAGTGAGAAAAAAAAGTADSPKSDKKKPSSDTSSDANDSNGDDNNAVPVDTSAGFTMSFKAEMMWVTLVLAAMI